MRIKVVLVVIKEYLRDCNLAWVSDNKNYWSIIRIISRKIMKASNGRSLPISSPDDSIALILEVTLPRVCGKV